MHTGSSYITAFGALLVVSCGILENILLKKMQPTTNMIITIKIIITQIIAITAPTDSESESESESSKVYRKHLIYVTGFGKTDHIVTIDILRNTNLKY